MRDLFYPGRSVIHATNGMAATSHPLSTATAVNILNDGGNAAGTRSRLKPLPFGTFIADFGRLRDCTDPKSAAQRASRLAKNMTVRWSDCSCR